MSLVDHFLDHFRRQFRTLDGVYERASESAWTYQDARTKGVWQWLLHILETVEFYLSEKPDDQFPWGHRFDVDWENSAAERVPTKDEMQTYQRDIEQLVRRVLAVKSDQDMTAPEVVAPWTGTPSGPVYLGKLLYLIRHTQQHIGDVNQILRLCGDPSLEWH
jgi:uncharacterized damage-inducible protein DinB